MPPGATRELTAPLVRQDQTCMATFTVSPTAVPAVVTGGANPDPRELGIHFTRFAYHAS